MDFAKRVLEKYGWSEGQGLGKESTGIKTAINPKVKLNTFGLGHDVAQSFTYRWWEDAFNDAACNVNVENTADGVVVDTVTEDSIEISAVKRSKIKRDKLKYDTFVKRETLTKEGVEQAPENHPEPIVERLPKITATLTDEELFQACGGLTAHKAARHGHKLSGKLERVRKQEEAFLKAFQKNKIKNSEHCDSTEKKRKRCDEEANIISELDSPSPVLAMSEKKRKKKREREHLDDSEKVIEYESSEVPCDSENVEKTIKKKKRPKKSKNLCDIEEMTEVAGISNITEAPSERKNKKKKVKMEKLVEEESEVSEMPCHSESSKKSKSKRKREKKE